MHIPPREYGFQNDAYRDNAKRDRERGGSTVRVYNTSNAMWRARGGTIPTEEELAAWSDRYDHDREAETAELLEHWQRMNMTDDDLNEFGARFGDRAPITETSKQRPARPPRESAMTPIVYRKICRKLGITTAQSADFLGVTERQVQRWLAGSTPIPDLQARVMRLLRAGAISLDDLRDT